MKKSVTIEIVPNGVQHHGGSFDHYGDSTVKIAGINMPVKDVDGKKVGIIREITIKNGNIEFEALIQDTPEMRRKLGVDGFIGSMGCTVQAPARRRKKR